MMGALRIGLLLLLSPALQGQTTGEAVSRILRPPHPPLQNADATAFQLRQYIVRLVPKLVVPESAENWTRESKRLREKLLGVAFHGWPREWVESAPVFDDLGTIAAGRGYRLRKLRYQ